MVPLRLLARSMSRPSGIAVQSHVGDGQVATTGKGAAGARRAMASLAAARVDEAAFCAKRIREGRKGGMYRREVRKMPPCGRVGVVLEARHFVK